MSSSKCLIVTDLIMSAEPAVLDVLDHDDDILIVNKPAGLVCHPTKDGPLSSLIGRVRLHLGHGRAFQLEHRVAPVLRRFGVALPDRQVRSIRAAFAVGRRQGGSTMMRTVVAALAAAVMSMLAATGVAQAKSLDDILKAGVIRIGINPSFIPNSYRNAAGEWASGSVR